MFSFSVRVPRIGRMHHSDFKDRIIVLQSKALLIWIFVFDYLTITVDLCAIVNQMTLKFELLCFQGDIAKG